MSADVVTKRFSGRVAIVTGGVHGIGRATVDLLRAQGAKVMIADNDPAGDVVLQEFGADRLNVGFIGGDMEEEDFSQSIVDATNKQFGRIDYLVNNAYAFTAKGMDGELKHWRRSLDVGVIGFARMIQCVAPSMIKAGGGSIVNVASTMAHIVTKDRWTYCAAKGAVLQLTKAAALDLGAHRIRINSVSPAWIWTREVVKTADLDGGGRAKWGPIWGDYHMLRRCGESSEVAAPIAFLLSDEASFITATDLAIDGGYLAMGPEGIGKGTAHAGSD